MFFAKKTDVPRGTLHLMLRILLVITTIFLASCNKPITNPELKDPIYNDLNVRLTEVSQLLAAEKTILKDHEKDLNESIPQTGQSIRAQKKVFESQNKIIKLEQEEQYLKLKVAARKVEATNSYSKAFGKNEPWPDPQEFEQYQKEKKAQRAPRDWSVKNRLKETGNFEQNIQDQKKSGEH